MSIGAAILLGLALMLLISESWLRSTKASSWITVALFVCAGFGFVGGYAPHLKGLVTGSLAETDSWHLFHYDLNARYLDELGYHSLYSCALLAAPPEAVAKVDLVRDLKTYALVPRSELPPCPRNAFTDTRWERFQSDVARILTKVPLPNNSEYAGWDNDQAAYVQAIFQDKGYNVTPFGARLTQRLFEFFPGTTQVQWRMFFLGEILLFLLSILLIGYGYTWRAASLYALWLVTFWGTYPFLTNMLLQHTWLPFLVGGLVALKKEKGILCGTFFAVTVVLRVFPVVFLLPSFIAWIQAEYRGEKNRLRFFRSAVMSFLGTILIGFLSGGTFSLWQEYLEKLHRHSVYLRGEAFDIGIPTLSHLLGGGTGLAIGLAIVITAVTTVVIRKKSLEQQTIWMLTVLFSWYSLSPYYYLVLILFALAYDEQVKASYRLSAIGVTVLFFAHAATGMFGLAYFSTDRGAHLASQLGILTLLLFQLGIPWIKKERLPGEEGVVAV